LQHGSAVIANQAEAKLDVADYIAGFYNCERLHSVLGNLPPSADERAMAEKELIVVSEISRPLQSSSTWLYRVGEVGGLL
jgi:hypothetical protein